jgi:Asp-tRNA(Asn)/Glu-tRNA(Gln) amidotransferase A subunit family amidase
VACERLVGSERVASPVEAAFAVALRRLAEVTGAEVEVADRGSLLDEEVHEAWARIYAPEDTLRFGREWLRSRPEGLAPGTMAWLDLGLSITFDEYLAARRRRFEFVRLIDELLGEDAVLATPTVTVEGYPANGVLPGASEPDLPTGLYNTSPFNLTGHPALSLPATVTESGMPFGLQLVGPRLCDLSLLALAGRFEEAYPWPLAAPGYEPFTLP